MDPFSRVRSYYIQGAPTRVVIDLIKQCPDWSEFAFQERIVNEALLFACSNGVVHQPSADPEERACPGLRVPLRSEVFRYADAEGRCKINNCTLSIVHRRFLGPGV